MLFTILCLLSHLFVGLWSLFSLAAFKMSFSWCLNVSKWGFPSVFPALCLIVLSGSVDWYFSTILWCFQFLPFWCQLFPVLHNVLLLPWEEHAKTSHIVLCLLNSLHSGSLSINFVSELHYSSFLQLHVPLKYFCLQLCIIYSSKKFF